MERSGNPPTLIGWDVPVSGIIDLYAAVTVDDDDVLLELVSVDGVMEAGGP